MLAKLFKLVVLIFCILLAVVFTLYNSEEPVKVDLYYAQIHWPLTYIMLVAIFIGFLLGLLATAVLLVKTRTENRKLRRAVRIHEKDLKALRNAPSKDAY